MINIQNKTLIILPHLDDEFALTPLIKKMSSINKEINIIYCSERIRSTFKKQIRRRKDNLKALKIIGVNIDKVLYLNDYFRVEDNKLFKSSLEIFDFFKKLFDNEFYSQVFTLNFEGGHPDHDQIALIVNKLRLLYNFKAFYFPAYNSRPTLFLPYSVLRPLKSQENNFYFMEFKNFCWIDVIRIAFSYSTERFAFILLSPLLILKIFFSRKLIYFDKINIASVNWDRSLSYKRYKVDLSILIKLINKMS